jgi:hypothetical protein
VVSTSVRSASRAKGSSDYDIWFTPVLIGQYDLSERWQAAFRVEYYQDEDEVIIAPLVGNGFRTTGLSLNLDYCPNRAHSRSDRSALVA